MFLQLLIINVSPEECVCYVVALRIMLIFKNDPSLVVDEVSVVRMSTGITPHNR